jgi:catechol 2,3-dioxygenase-like lactoylglutathione lyase family enzyme
MKYLHTMIRVSNLEESLDFYCNKLGLKQCDRRDFEDGRFSLIFLAAEGDEDAQVELTYNWDPQEYDEGRHLRNLPTANGCWRDHKPPAPRRAHGFRQISRQHLCRTTPKWRSPGTAGTLGEHGKHRQMVVKTLPVT